MSSISTITIDQLQHISPSLPPMLTINVASTAVSHAELFNLALNTYVQLAVTSKTSCPHCNFERVSEHLHNAHILGGRYYDDHIPEISLQLLGLAVVVLGKTPPESETVYLDYSCIKSECAEFAKEQTNH